MERLLDHPAIRAVADATRGTEFEGQLFMVGGAVRDALLGRPSDNDFDLVTELSASQLAELLWNYKIADNPPAIYARFGTSMVTVQGVQIEIVTARRESYRPGSRKPDVEPATLVDDAKRRDFTCNTLMLGIHPGELVDYLGDGLADLRARILRTPLGPAATFRDDPLRMLRAVRFRHALGFEYARDLAESLPREASHLQFVSMERIRDEFTKMLLGPSPSGSLEDLRRFGLLAGWADELESMVGVTQGQYHYADVWTHTLHVLENVRADSIELALAALLHDIGKPATRSIDDQGQVRFFRHEIIGAEIARTLCFRWRFSQRVCDSVVLMVRHHMRLTSMDKVSASAARRIVRDLGPELENWMRLIEADAGALKSGVRQLDLAPLRQQVERVTREQPSRRWDSPLSGDEIMNLLELESGPEVGRIKAWLSDQVLEGELHSEDRDRAEQLIRERFRNPSAKPDVNRSNSYGDT